jgi:lipoyl(octanoyl) transferase
VINNVIYRDLGLIEYAKAWEYQQKLHAEILSTRHSNSNLPVCEHTACYYYLLLCEHPHVFTIGKSGKSKNLLVNQEFLKSREASFFKTDRGGDITYHGPGQIVGYPLFDLDYFGVGVKKYIFNLEEAVIRTLAEFSIKGERLQGAAGVWLDVADPSGIRKICAIGVRVSRGVTMHGFALNVNTDLEYYRYINPCGYTDKDVTSFQNELRRKVQMNVVKKRLIANLANVFQFVI